VRGVRAIFYAVESKEVVFVYFEVYRAIVLTERNKRHYARATITPYRLCEPVNDDVEITTTANDKWYGHLDALLGVASARGEPLLEMALVRYYEEVPGGLFPRVPHLAPSYRNLITAASVRRKVMLLPNYQKKKKTTYVNKILSVVDE
jgi:hypothetical protein